MLSSPSRISEDQACFPSNNQNIIFSTSDYHKVLKPVSLADLKAHEDKVSPSNPFPEESSSSF
jgi:hypothetical protein